MKGEINLHTNSPCLFGTKLAQWILPGGLSRLTAMAFYDAQNFSWRFSRKQELYQLI